MQRSIQFSFSKEGEAKRKLRELGHGPSGAAKKSDLPNERIDSNNKIQSLKGMPLAARVRPKKLEEYFGQEKILDNNGILINLLSAGKVPNIIFWGPPGTGKTTLARIIANISGLTILELSGASNGLSDVREVATKARNYTALTGKKCIVFVDEIHRLSKSQQDFFLPPVENGNFVFISATTENPSFRINNALISRCQVIVLDPLSNDAITRILKRALNLENPELKIEDAAFDFISSISNGDARAALNILDNAMSAYPNEITVDCIKRDLKGLTAYYDRNCEEHYNIISAFHKSIRGGDIDASLYWLWRMLNAGEDPLYIARRLIRAASEDIGIANNNGLTLALSTYQACQIMGMPECGCCLSHCTVYLAQSPKSVAVYKAEKLVTRFIRESRDYPVPMHIRNSPTPLMEDLGYGKRYMYPPSHPEGHPENYSYLPPEMGNCRFFGVFEELSGQGEDKFCGHKQKCCDLPRREFCVKKAP